MPAQDPYRALAADLATQYPQLTSADLSISRRIAFDTRFRRRLNPGVESPVDLALSKLRTTNQDLARWTATVAQDRLRLATSREKLVEAARQQFLTEQLQAGVAGLPVAMQVQAADNVNRARASVAEAQAQVDAIGSQFEQSEQRRQTATIESDQFLAEAAAAVGRREAALSAAQRADARYRGVPIEADAVIIQFKPTTPISRVQALLTKYNLTVRAGDGIPSIGLLVVTLPPVGMGGSSLASLSVPQPDAAASLRLSQLLAALREEPDVKRASQNPVLGSAEIPPPSSLKVTIGGQERRIVWEAPAAVPPTGGNYNLEVARFPQAWNFASAISRGGKRVKVAILDEGFGSHPDLHYTMSGARRCGFNEAAHANARDHGTHVMGVVGAVSSGANGITGGTRFAELVGCVPRYTAFYPAALNINAAFTDIICALSDLIEQEPDLRVVNISLSYKWYELGVSADTDFDAQQLAAANGEYVQDIADRAMQAERDIVIVAAAGNDHGAPARWASPFTNAALSPDAGHLHPNIIVVESVGRSGSRSQFSNIGGQVAAPGEDIVSTIAAASRYGAMSGTSMAAPHVTALVALMLAYNPRLNATRVAEILRGAGAGGDAAAPSASRIDAFRAMVASDARALKDLCDLNNDGRVDIHDFEIFREALRQVEGNVAVVRKDLNGDGRISDDENVFPRADLNGSGRLSRNAADLALVGGRLVSDLDVMMSVWEDSTTPAAALPGLLDAAPAN